METPKIFQLQNMGEKLASLQGIGAKKLADDKLSAVCVLRVCEGAKIHIMSQLPVRKLIVASDALGAKSLARKIESWGVKVDYLPYRDDVLIARKGFSAQGMRERICALKDIVCGEVDVVVTAADSLLQLFPKRELVEKYTVCVKKEDVISPQVLADKLALAGYKRQAMVQDVGDFAVRGDIVDVCDISGVAYRINFFDELVENIKVIDVESMLASNEVQSVNFAPASDILLDEKGYEFAREKLSLHPENKNAQQAKELLSVGACDASSVWALPFLKDCTQSLFDFFDDDKPTLVIFDEPRVVADKLQILEKEFAGRIKTLCEGAEILPEHKDVCITAHEVKRQLIFLRKMGFGLLPNGELTV